MNAFLSASKPNSEMSILITSTVLAYEPEKNSKYEPLLETQNNHGSPT